MTRSRPELELVRILANHAPLQSLAVGEVMLRKGEPLDHVIVVVSGELVAGPASRGQSSARVLPGQALSPPGGIGAWGTCPVDLRADVPTKLYRVTAEVILRLMANHASVLAPLIVAGEERAVELAASAPDGPNGALLIAYGPRGGAGVTTCAILSAARAARAGRSVLLVDVHRWFGTAAMACDVRPRQDLVDVLEGEVTAADLVEAVEPTPAGFDLLASPMRPERGDQLPRERLQELLALARQVYDFVVVDLEAGLDPVTLDVLELAGEDADLVVLLPANLEGVMTGRRCMEILDHLGVPPEAISPIFNRHRADGVVPAETLAASLLRSGRVVAEDHGQLAAAAERGELCADCTPLREHPLAGAVDAVVSARLGLELEATSQAAGWTAGSRPSWMPRLLASALGSVGLRWLVAG